MNQQIIICTVCVLFSVQTNYHIEARGFNGGKDSTNAKDLKEIESRIQEGLDAIKKAGEKINSMKPEQKGFEKDLGIMLKTHSDAPAKMKKMLDDQKGMQDEVSKLQKEIKDFENKFGKWIKDIKGFQKKPDDMATYEALKPFIKELDAMADHCKSTTKKFVDQAKRYKDFGQSMFESGKIDTSVNKWLCSLGSTIEGMGQKVSDVGDPIAQTSERIGDIWQRTNAKDKDTTLSSTSKKLTPKGQAVVSDGDKQATSGKELRKMCEKVAEKAKSMPKGQDKKELTGRIDMGKVDEKKDTNIDCKKELGEIAKALDKLSKERHELELLRHNLESTQELEEEFEGMTKEIPDHGTAPKELEELAEEVGKIMEELVSVKNEVKDIQCEGKKIEVVGDKIVDLCDRILKVVIRWRDLSKKLLSNGQGLVDRYIYTKQMKEKYDVVGDRVEHAGNLILGGISPTIGSMEQHFVNVGKFMGGEFKRTFTVIGTKLRGVAGPLKGHGEEIRDYGIKIKRLKPEPKKEKKKEPKIEEKKEKVVSDENKSLESLEKQVNDVDISFVLESTKPEVTTQEPESESREKEKMIKWRPWGRGWQTRRYDMRKDWTEESVSYEQTHRKTHGVKLYFPVNIWKDSEDKMNLLANGPREERRRDEGYGTVGKKPGKKARGKNGKQRKGDNRPMVGKHGTHGKFREEKLRHDQKHRSHW